MFKGHHFIKLINDSWVLDITEYCGYKVLFDNNKEIVGYKKAFSIEANGEELSFNKYMKVPLKVLKEAHNQVIEYQKGS